LTRKREEKSNWTLNTLVGWEQYVKASPVAAFRAYTLTNRFVSSRFFFTSFQIPRCEHVCHQVMPSHDANNDEMMIKMANVT